VNDPGFGGIVGRLKLRNVDNMAAHAGSSDEASVPIVHQCPAIDVCTLLFLPPPDSTSRPGTIEGAIKIRSYNLAIMIDFAIEHRPLGPWYTSIGHENIQAAIEFFDDLIDSYFDLFVVRDIDLVCSASTLRDINIHP